MTDFAILCTLQTEKYTFLCSFMSKNLTFSCIFYFFYSTFAAVFEPRSIIFIHFFAVYCYGNLFKAGQLLHCNNLTLVMAYGEKRDIVQDGKTVHCVLASDWLLQQ